jgi:hypothetical protein
VRKMAHKGATRIDEDGDTGPLDLSRGIGGYEAGRMLAGLRLEDRERVIEGIVDRVARDGIRRG